MKTKTAFILTIVNIVVFFSVSISGLVLLISHASHDGYVDNYYYAKYGDGIELVEYTGNEKNIVVPDTLAGYKVVALGKSVYKNNKQIETAIVHDSIRHIGEGAFTGCDNLVSITLPFVGASKTTTGYRGMFGYIFGYNTYTTDNFSMPNSHHYIENNFSGKGGKYAFYSYTVPASLTTAIITGGTAIRDRVFYGCSNLTAIEIPNTVTSIGSYAFCYTNIASTIIPPSVTSIGGGAFYWCNKLKTIYFNATNCSNFASSVDSPFNSSPTETLIIGANVIKVPANMFYAGRSLKSIIFEMNSQCASIDNSTFRNCGNLTSVVIPKKIVSIAVDAFRDCSRLTTVYYEGADVTIWNTIAISTDNSKLINANRYYYSNTPQADCWRYVNGVPTLWE